MYEEAGEPGVITELNDAANLHQTRMNQRIVDASAMLQSALCMVIMLALAGCGSPGSAAGSTRNDPGLKVDEPACYRDARSEYEAAGASKTPNAALLDIGAALASRDNGLEKCVPAVSGKNNHN
jgi:hypothetical protein